MPYTEQPAGSDMSSLVAQARSGDDAAFERIVEHYGSRVIGYCRRIAGPDKAEDLAQEVFVKLHLALPSVALDRSLSPFLFRTAHNHCIDWLRKKKIPTISIHSEDREDALPGPVDPPDAGGSPEELLLRAEFHSVLEQALAGLPIEYRSVLLLRHREELSYEEIAATMDLPLATVKTRIHRGRERLKQTLREYVVPDGRGR